MVNKFISYIQVPHIQQTRINRKMVQLQRTKIIHIELEKDIRESRIEKRINKIIILEQPHRLNIIHS